MRRARAAITPLAVAALVAFPGQVRAAGDEDSTLAVGKLGKRIATWLKSTESAGFSGAVLTAKQGKVVAACGVGSADLKGRQRVTPGTLFEIASATKQFTGAAVVLLVDRGKLELDDPIADHLPGVPEDCRAITVRHLLQHTSGIPGTNSAGRGDRVEQVLPSFLKGGPRHPPGTHWEYWNQGYALLSEIIARAAGQDYVTFCKRNLFAPAGMKATCFTGDKPPRGAKVAVGRSARGQPRSALDHPYGSYGFQYRGMGGAVTSVWDLWRWDRALHGAEVLSADAKAALFRPGLKGYALGWYVKKGRDGRLVQSHGGSVRGFVCEIRRYPVEDGCLFVLSNRDDAPLRRVADGVEELLFGGDPKPMKAPPPPLTEELAKAIAGRYLSDRGDELVIERAGAKVRFRLHWTRPAGAVTRGIIGRDGKSRTTVLFDDGSDVGKIKIKRKGRKPVHALSWSGIWYRRRK
jgi:CubicO group peptidase (beta-lactamase class C family)